MSDLAATNCGGGCSCNEGGCGSILWIILLLCCCGGNNGICGGNNGCGNDCLWIIILYSAVADVAITTDAAVAASSYKLDHRSKKKGIADAVPSF